MPDEWKLLQNRSNTTNYEYREVILLLFSGVDLENRKWECFIAFHYYILFKKYKLIMNDLPEELCIFIEELNPYSDPSTSTREKNHTMMNRLLKKKTRKKIEWSYLVHS
jgi:hypothetical protein